MKLKIEKSKKKDNWNLLKFDKQEEQLNEPVIEILGNKSITIEGCQGVSQYTDNYLKLRLRKGYVILTGSNFDIVFFENKLITVNGKISSIEFSI